MDNQTPQEGIIPGQSSVDKVIQQRNQRRFFEEKKLEQREKIIPNIVEDQFKYLKEQQKTWRDEKFDFNSHMERAVPFSFKPEEISSQQDFTENIIERGSLSSDKLGAVSIDKILDAVNSAVQGTATLVASTTLSNGDQAVLTTTLSDSADLNRIMLAVAHITSYLTSVASTNVIPYGSSVTPGQWLWHNRADWGSNDNIKASWIDYVRNVSAGASKAILWRLQWRYIGRPALEA